MKLFSVTLLLATLCCSAAESGQDKGFPAMFEAACRELEVPLEVTMAIAQVESGFNPWTLNIAGRGYHFDSKAEALAQARTAQKSGRSFDVGLMQVNNWWLKRFDISLEEAFDPQANIYLGSWILKSELERHKDLRAAVGAYHSPKPARARKYADKVMAVLMTGSRTASPQASGASSKVAPKVRNKSRKSLETAPSPMLISSGSAVLAVANQSLKAVYAAEQSMKVNKK